VVKAKYGLSFEDIEIHKEVVLEIKGRKIGLFAMLDKNMKRKMSEKNKIDFVEVFELDDEIKEISYERVKSLKEKGAEFIIVITNMDGDYSKLQNTKLEFKEGDANSMSCVVDGVDLVLDACN
jgi:2',3'-cyclic-nucleotide 2'-phosphodiesterase (5'-nucleotidase family)